MDATATPSAVEQLIDRIAEDKATRMRTLAKATVVICTTPEWVRAEEVNAIFGIPHNTLITLAVKGKIAARKTDPALRSSAVIFETASIRKAIGRMMPYADWVKERPDQESTTPKKGN